ncbi:hypothetical protein RCIA106 [Methanocella arvoryzae MRE50]|uniref:Uncharacterized protein n=1 Tax=Methanocella arvoryzae (strain DSM 22066 / NBRC 105507 / MRE50) TaxID=351160 RepID=Q0W4J7_METAR|nr:hypothetical protein RCIA106 [Methanocella arvoryzae MRE50]
MRRWPGNGRLPKAVSLSACEGGSTGAAEGAARSYRRGCERGPDIGAPETTSSPPSGGRRPAIIRMNYRQNGRRPARIE